MSRIRLLRVFPIPPRGSRRVLVAYHQAIEPHEGRLRYVYPLSGGGAPLGEVVVPVPEGCVIADSRIEQPYLVLRLDGLAERGCQQVVLVDLESGRVTGRVTAVADR